MEPLSESLNCFVVGNPKRDWEKGNIKKRRMENTEGVSRVYGRESQWLEVANNGVLITILTKALALDSKPATSITEKMPPRSGVDLVPLRDHQPLIDYILDTEIDGLIQRGIAYNI